MGEFVSTGEESARVLADPAWQRVLFALLADHLFLTAGQAEHLRRRTAPLGASAELMSGSQTRSVLNSLAAAGFLGSAHAFLPKTTIGQRPLFVLRRPEGDLPDVSRCIAAATERLEPLHRHADRKLFFAKDAVCPILRAAGFHVPFWKSDEAWHAREKAFRTIHDRHQEVTARTDATPREIACTLLTAHYNLNQVRLADTFPEPPPLAKGKFSAYGNLALKGPEADLSGSTFEKTGLFFLRPLRTHEMREQIETCCEESSVTHYISEFWWM